MLLPDQTYEQMAPLAAFKSQFNGNRFKPKKLQRLIKNFGHGNRLRNDLNTKCRLQIQDSCNEIIEEVAGEEETDSSEDDISDEWDSSDTSQSYDNTSDFFNNIPEFDGEPLGPFSLNDKCNDNKTAHISDDVLKEFETFLWRYRIRPDFFCRYRKVIKYGKTFILV